METAYQGFLVSGFTPTVAPNPRCCSEVTTLCPRCAAEALWRAGVRNQLVVNQAPLNEILVPPLMELVWNGLDSISQMRADEEREYHRQAELLRSLAAVEAAEARRVEEEREGEYEERMRQLNLPRYGNVDTPAQPLRNIAGRGEILEYIVPHFGADDDEPACNQGSEDRGEVLEMRVIDWTSF